MCKNFRMAMDQLTSPKRNWGWAFGISGKRLFRMSRSHILVPGFVIQYCIQCQLSAKVLPERPQVTAQVLGVLLLTVGTHVEFTTPNFTPVQL